MNLSGSELKKLREALIDAYPKKAQLEMLISDADLGNLNAVAGGDDYTTVVFNLIKEMQSKGNLKKLIKAAYDENPNNPKLKEFVQNRQTIFDCANISNNFNLFPEQYWKEICSILVEIHIDLITDACRCTLENISKNQDVLGAYPELSKLDIPTLKNILLQKCPYNDKKAPTIVEFAERLASDVQQPYQNKLNGWVETVAKQLKIKLPTYSQSNKLLRVLQPTLQSYLMIIVTPIDKNKVSLEAELITDYQSKDKQPPIKIELVEAQTNVTCSFTKIADNIYNFIRESRKKLKGKKNNLTIEVFLPFQYLNKGIEFDEIIYGKEIKHIGREHSFIVRSLERFSTDDEEYLNNLYKRWDILEEFLLSSKNEQEIQNKFESLCQVDNYNWDELENNWLLEEKFGIKVHCLPKSDGEQIKFFQTILRAGVPISLWARCDNLIDIDTLDSFLAVKYLRNFNHFFESVWKLRRVAYAKQDRVNYLGYNIGFLCDNPYRLPFRLIPENQDFVETGF